MLTAIQFTHIMDFVIMMPLGPQLMRSFQISPSEFSWLVSAYNLSAALSGLVSSFFVDRFDRKRSLMFMYLGFAISTLLCATAHGFWGMLGARTAAGAFGGVLAGMTFAIVGDSIHESRRGFATGIIMSAFSISSIIGIPTGLLLASKFGWNAPFFLLVGISFLVMLLGFHSLPEMRDHLAANQNLEPWARFKAVMYERNHIRAFILAVAMMFSAFSVIPFISPYLVYNVGIREIDLATVYFVGGTLTLISNSLIGKLSDRVGKFSVFRFVALFSVIPIFALTHLPPLPLAIAVIATAVFTLSVSGRYVPFMAMITSSVEQRLRGSFMSIFTCIQQLGSGMASFVSGWIVTRSQSGQIEHYGTVGIMACTMTIVSVVLASRLQFQSGTPAHPKYPGAAVPRQG